MTGRSFTMDPTQFWDKVLVGDGCWEWQGYRDACGYGSSAGKRTHRIAWELWFGPIPTGQLVLHRCDNPPCGRPDHLFLGTHTDNQQDSARKGRRAQQKRTHCPRGHEYTPENTITQSRTAGGRACRICKNEVNRRYMRGYYESHREDVLAYQREYRESHQEAIADYQREYHKRGRSS